MSQTQAHRRNRPEPDSISTGTTKPGVSLSLGPLWTVLVCTLILFARKSDSFLNPQFVVEDGIVYFMEARNEGVESLWKPYMGSLYLFQRAMAYVGNWIPLAYLPPFYNGMALAAALGVVAYISLSQIDVKNKWLMAIAVVAVPHNGEVLMHLTNAHWILALGVIVFLISREPASLGQKIADSLIVVVACLSGPYILFFLPLFLIRAVIRRSVFSVAVALFAVLCFCLQMGVLNFEHRFVHGDKPVHFADPEWLGFFGNDLSGVLLLGPTLTQKIPNSAYLAILSALLYGTLLAYALWRRNKECAVFLWAAASLLLAAAYAFQREPGAIHSSAYRYTYIPVVCTAWALIVVMENSRWLVRPAAFLLFLITLSSMTSFRSPALPDLKWKEASECIGGPVPCSIPVNGPGVDDWHIFYVPGQPLMSKWSKSAD